MSEPVWVALSALLISPGEPPMDSEHLTDLVNGKRVDLRPVEIASIPDHPGIWRIKNGRHRYVAAMMLGNSHIMCREVSA